MLMFYTEPYTQKTTTNVGNLFVKTHMVLFSYKTSVKFHLLSRKLEKLLEGLRNLSKTSLNFHIWFTNFYMESDMSAIVHIHN